MKDCFKTIKIIKLQKCVPRFLSLDYIVPRKVLKAKNLPFS